MTIAVRYWLALSLVYLPCAAASVVVGGTRLLFEGSRDEATLAVVNHGRQPTLIQSWLSQADAYSVNRQTFIVTPPLFRLDAGQKNSIRVLLSGVPQAEDRESMYWLNIKSIPAIDDSAPANRVEIAINTQIKFIYRPRALLQATPEKRCERLQWRLEGRRLTVKNPTPYYMNFSVLQLNGRVIEGATFVAPGQHAEWTVASALSHGTIRWRLISDYGLPLPWHSQQL
ncbi:MAG: fimbria/pilus periplasmic chaperone [Scandinavium sp.]|uniref:fimbria/pilus periplasmic chaperone n=1 Tax=Scandinavium sp. TaxID=2830653 RepID=UPI003F34970E